MLTFSCWTCLGIKQGIFSHSSFLRVEKEKQIDLERLVFVMLTRRWVLACRARRAFHWEGEGTDAVFRLVAGFYLFFHTKKKPLKLANSQRSSDHGDRVDPQRTGIRMVQTGED